MHELSLCEDIISLLEKRAKADDYSQIKSIQLEIGKLSCVEPKALAFAFDAAAKGSLAENARLDIEEIPGQAWCEQCAVEVVIEQRFDVCPQCENYPLAIRRGDNMRIKYIEVI